MFEVRKREKEGREKDGRRKGERGKGERKGRGERERGKELSRFPGLDLILVGTRTRMDVRGMRILLNVQRLKGTWIV